MLATATDLQTWTAALTAALTAQPNLDVYTDNVGSTGMPTYRLDGDGAVHQSAVLLMGLDTPQDVDDALCGNREISQLNWQVTCVGGDADRARRAALKVRAALTGKTLIDRAGRIQEQLDTLRVLEDGSIKPARYSVPMLFTVQIP